LVQATNYADVRIHGLEVSANAPVVTRRGIVTVGVSSAFTRGTITKGINPLDGSTLDGAPADNITPIKVLAFGRFTETARGTRRLGSAAIDLAYVACGRFDGFWELRLGAWDVAAGSVLVEEAGGTVTGIDGRPLDLDAPTLVATNGLVQRAVLDVLAEVRRR